MHRHRHLIHSHPRLIIGCAVGVLAALLVPSARSSLTRLLIGWNAGVWTYLVLMSWLMLRASHARVRRIAEQENNSPVTVLVLLSIAAALSIAAILLELASAKSAAPALRLFHYGFTAVTVLGSWLLVGVIYTVHYANLFYRSPHDKRALRFPDDEAQPDYWDFLYFAFCIAVAAQTADVSIMSKAMRKAVMAQSILSFLFNAAIIGLSINIAAGLVGT